ncbi:hypothetical protein T190_07950 [Sinorhizobium meliloti CCBAU 01290]|nr:hypothetical protein T190_07950 [Sinorhizobium meliloti CCBAU 01290]
MVAQWEKRGVALQHRDDADLSARCRGIGSRSEVAAASIAQAIQALLSKAVTRPTIMTWSPAS